MQLSPCRESCGLESLWFHGQSWSIITYNHFSFFLFSSMTILMPPGDNPVLLDQSLGQPQQSDSSGISLTWWLSFRIIPSLEALTAKQKRRSVTWVRHYQWSLCAHCTSLEFFQESATGMHFKLVRSVSVTRGSDSKKEASELIVGAKVKS